MRREYKAFLRDILDASLKIDKYIENVTLEEFKEIQDAVIINLIIIGEATKNIPPEIQDLNPEIEWKKIVGLRDILIHAYFGIDVNIIWDIIKNKIPDLKIKIVGLISEISK